MRNSRQHANAYCTPSYRCCPYTLPLIAAHLSDLTCVPLGPRFSCYSIPAQSCCTSKLPANGVTWVSSPTPHMSYPNYLSLPCTFSSPDTRQGLLSSYYCRWGIFKQGLQSTSPTTCLFSSTVHLTVCRVDLITVRAHTEAVGSNRRGVPTAW